MIRQVAWPELTSRDIARGQDIVDSVVTADADAVGWLRLGGMADEVHRFDLATGADEVVASGPIVDVQLAGAQMLVRDLQPDDTSRLRLQPPSPGWDVYSTRRQVDSFRWSPGDETLYVLEQEVGKAPVVSVVRDGHMVDTSLDTAAAAHLSLAPKDGQIVYVDQSLARLVSQEATELSGHVLVDAAVRTGEVSRDGVIAYVVWPEEGDVTTPLCFKVPVE